ncbi:MAG: hypothetical protein K2W82_10915 [Candidatus Obscuribacterales bacterium]|nr:hypothetical protein [Candidatus Obscuribacterales bacterium]
MSFMSSCLMVGGFLSVGLAVGVMLGIIPGRLQRLTQDQTINLVGSMCGGGIVAILFSVC